MKKLLILAGLLVTIASYGGSVTPVHAQSLTPAQAAAAQQQIDVLKAELVKLQMDHNAIPAGDNNLPGNDATITVTTTAQPTATASLSAADVASIKSALSALAVALQGIETQVAANPSFAASHQQSIAAVLQGMGSTLTAIVSQVQSSNMSNVAMVTPETTSMHGSGASTGSGIAQAMPQPVATAAPTQNSPSMAAAPSNDNAAAPLTSANALPSVTTNPTPQTAQATSVWSKVNWPLIIVIVLIVAAIAVWLWWDDEDTKKPVVKTVTINSKPNPTVTTMNQQVSQNRAPSMPAQTPLSASMETQRKPA